MYLSHTSGFSLSSWHDWHSSIPSSEGTTPHRGFNSPFLAEDNLALVASDTTLPFNPLLILALWLSDKGLPLLLVKPAVFDIL